MEQAQNFSQGNFDVENSLNEIAHQRLPSSDAAAKYATPLFYLVKSSVAL